MDNKTFLVAVILASLSPMGLGIFGEIRICKGEQSRDYNKIGETLANDYGDKFLTYDQIINTTAVITKNATFEPLCMRDLTFSYYYYLKEQNISTRGVLLATLELVATKSQSICECKVQHALFYLTDTLNGLGKAPSKDAIESVLQSFGYIQHPDWYKDCPVLYEYLRRVVYDFKIGRLNEEKIQEIQTIFKNVGRMIMYPLLVHKTGPGNSFLDFLSKKNQFYCLIYNSSAKAFAQKRDKLGNEQTLFLVETVKNKTGNSRINSSCLDYFLEEYGRQSDALGTPKSMYYMLESLYRNNPLLSTVTDHDQCECRIPSLSKELVGDLLKLGPSPNDTAWNQTMTKYYYVGWSLEYKGCPVLEWYLEGFAAKYGIEATNRRYLEVGFEMATVLHPFSQREYWR